MKNKLFELLLVGMLAFPIFSPGQTYAQATDKKDSLNPKELASDVYKQAGLHTINGDLKYTMEEYPFLGKVFETMIYCDEDLYTIGVTNVFFKSKQYNIGVLTITRKVEKEEKATLTKIFDFELQGLPIMAAQFNGSYEGDGLAMVYRQTELYDTDSKDYQKLTSQEKIQMYQKYKDLYLGALAKLRKELKKF